MSDTHSNQPDLQKREVHEPAESQAAASSAAHPASPIAAVDTQKLLELLKNPSASLKLEPTKDWIYGAIGAGAGVIGFVLWTWLYQSAFKARLSLFDVLGGFVLVAPGRLFVIGLFSIALLIGSLTLFGNWQGSRKRDWKEAVAHLGGTQLIFGAGWIASGLIAFLSLQLSMLIGAVLLLINLVMLVGQAEDLHGVSRERRFLYIVYTISCYLLLLYLVFSIFA